MPTQKFGVMLYDSEECWEGYTTVQLPHGTAVIDMEGNIVKLWRSLNGFPARILPDGHILCTTKMKGLYNTKGFEFMECVDLVQLDWEGNVEWSFNKGDFTKDGTDEPQWFLYQHHDYQREGSPAGCYTPGLTPLVEGGKTIMLTRKLNKVPSIAEYTILDERIIEVDWEGNIIWEWLASDHFDEFGFSEAAKKDIYSTYRENEMFERLAEDKINPFLHINAVSWVGQNKWYDAGDNRFNPNNIIISSRLGNFCAIIDHETKEIVWRLGPDVTETSIHLQTIGQHQPHIIQPGMPGEGNMLIFDNGGTIGYGKKFQRAYSRVIEVDPVDMTIKWEYPKTNHWLYSEFTSSAQRLPNGNTLIAEGKTGRIVEITKAGKTVWTFKMPPLSLPDGTSFQMVYRAYRYPYSYLPIEAPVKGTNKYNIRDLVANPYMLKDMATDIKL